jgi:5'-3' exonuclease
LGVAKISSLRYSSQKRIQYSFFAFLLLIVYLPDTFIMGVPALFRWLSKKYPKIISSVIEELPQEVNGEEIPVDITGPNPNGEEMDNLYLDMNGIVHPCTHPEGKPPPANEQEMMIEIFKYTDRVVNMVRPRKLLMIAVGMFSVFLVMWDL